MSTRSMLEHADELLDQGRGLETEFGPQELAIPAVLAKSLRRIALGQMDGNHSAMGAFA
jgi:hypothetical protein